MKKIFLWGGALFILFIGLECIKSQHILIEKYYSNGIYRLINKCLFFLFDWSPFSIGDVLYFITGAFLLFQLIKIVLHSEQKTISLFTYILKISTIFLLWFNISWGLNNYRTPLHHRFDIKLDYNESDLEQITKELIAITNEYQCRLTNDENKKVIYPKNMQDFYQAARNGYNNSKDVLNLPIDILSIPHSSLYSSFLSKAGVSGYFNPFTHENQVNGHIHYTTLPLTTAHEMAHQLGIAKESEANFIAFLVMSAQSVEEYQYAASLYAMKYALKEWNAKNPEKYAHYYYQLNHGSRQNIEDNNLFWSQNKNFTSNIFKFSYGNFLKINNQTEGMQSYNRFVDLLINFNKKYRILSIQNGNIKLPNL